jgi:hypothetical protein
LSHRYGKKQPTISASAVRTNKAKVLTMNIAYLPRNPPIAAHRVF